jgi:hypothetical protein
MVIDIKPISIEIAGEEEISQRLGEVWISARLTTRNVAYWM